VSRKTLATELRVIADKIEASTSPSRNLVASDIKQAVRGYTRSARTAIIKVTVVEVFDTINTEPDGDYKQVQRVRGSVGKYHSFTDRYKYPRYVVQGSDADGNIIIDNQGMNGEDRVFS